MKSTRLLLLSLAAAMLAACDSTSTTAVSDAPATDEQIAASRATDAAASAGFEGIVSDSDLAIGGSDLEVPATGEELLAARTVADPMVSDTLIGSWLIRNWTRGAWKRTDSIKVLVEDIGTRETGDIRASELVSRLDGPAFVQRSVLKDGDGDGYVLGNANEERIVNLEVTRKLGQISEVSKIRANSGPDGDIFAGTDNLVYSLSWTRYRGEDTVRAVRLFPVEGDTVISGDGRTDRLYGATLLHYGPFATRHLELVAHAHGTDTTIVGLTGKVEWVGGRTETISVKDLAGNATVEPGDTAVLRVTVEAPSADTMISSAFTAHIVAGSGLGHSDNRIILIEGRREFRSGPFVVETFRLQSDAGIVDGQDPTTGSFRWTATLRKGGEVSLVGTFTSHGITGTYTNAEGVTKEI